MKLAMVTSIYPSIMKYLKYFFSSLETQTDRNYSLWIGLDEVLPQDIFQFTNKVPNINFISAPKNASPSLVRNVVLQKAIKESEAVVLVDADDVLINTRVEAAKKSLVNADLIATAMKYIDDEGNHLSGRFNPKIGDPSLVKTNVFGFSNTTWKTGVLSRFIPVPGHCVIMDWYVATLALYSGAKLSIDPVPRMLYRQHNNNIAPVRPPFNSKQIIKSANLLLNHYNLIIKSFKSANYVDGYNAFVKARKQTQVFSESINNPKTLYNYVAELNKLPINHVWWSCVAHPLLEDIWKK